MEPSRYYSIIKNKTSVKFKLRMQKFYQINGTEERSLDSDMINDVFVLFPEDNNADYQEDLKMEANTTDDINKLEKINNVVELFLFKESVTGLRSKFNTVATGCNLTTLVSYLLARAGVNHVLMSPFENITTYGEIAVPPMEIEKCIRYLNNTFGFHKKGTVIFFGLLHAYILNYAGKCTAWYTNEYKETVIYVLDKSNVHGYLPGAFIKPDEQRNYYNATTDGIDIKSGSTANNVLTGVNPTTINLTSGGVTSSASNSPTVVGSANQNVVFSAYSNNFLSETITAQQNANDIVISITMDDVNMESFTPNKEFSIVFENGVLNQKYNGKYKLANSIYTFANGGEYFTISGVFTFKKVE